MSVSERPKSTIRFVLLFPEMVDEQHERLLPIANVGRIMKQILPPSAKVSKEAKETIQECATEFISFVTGEASDKCHKENRKTVNGDDICWALSSLGFDNYAEAMLRYLHRIREFERQRINQSKASSSNIINAAGDRSLSLSSSEEEEQEESDPTTAVNENNQSETITPPALFEFRVLDK